MYSESDNALYLRSNLTTLKGIVGNCAFWWNHIYISNHNAVIHFSTINGTISLEKMACNIGNYRIFPNVCL